MRMGDTFFNEWPAPMYQLAQMQKITNAEHEAIFALDTPVDEGAEDGAGAAMVPDLGEKVVPFPREFHVKLWQEMIRVGGIEAAVLLHPGSGQALLAFVLERKRAVGVVKDAKHKELMKKNLVQAVKTLGMAPDRRPGKPAELVAWEAVRSVGGLPSAAGGVPEAAVAKATGRPSLTVLPATSAVAAAAAQPEAMPPTGGVQPSLAAFGSSALR